MAEREALPIPVSRALDSSLSDDAIDRLWRVQDARSRRPSSRRARAVMLSLAAAALVGLGVLGGLAMRSPADGPLRLADGGRLPVELATATPERRTLGLDDGSWIALARGTLAHVVRNDARRMDLALERGRVRIEVVPGGPREWTIDAGLARVTVLGTELVVERRSGSVRVAVTRGHVSVEGATVPDGRRVVSAGEQLVVLARATDVADSAPIASPDPALEPEALRERAEPRTGVPPRTAARSRAPEDWRALAEAGDFEAAFALLGEGGIAAHTPTADPGALLLLADVARRAGRPRAAVSPLERLVAEFPDDPDAALGAFTLGKIRTEALRDPEGGARAFDTALRLHLPRSLVPETYARLATARLAAGDETAARSAASQYLRIAPAGSRAAEMRAMLAPP